MAGHRDYSSPDVTASYLIYLPTGKKKHVKTLAVSRGFTFVLAGIRDITHKKWVFLPKGIRGGLTV
jgi:hypothetical protein